MRSLILASLFGIFFTLVVIGALSISPLLDSEKGDRFLAETIDWLLPEPSLDEPSLPFSFSPSPSPQIAAIPASSSPRVLGSMTVNTVSFDTVYGLINGARRDQNKSPLVASRELERAAEILLQNTQEQSSAAPVDATSVIAQNNYEAKTHSALIATAPASNWDILTTLQKDPRQELLLLSTAFTEMGGAANCTQRRGTCVVIILLASR